MPRPVLVLVDPNDGRRQSFVEAFQRHFEVYSFASGDLAVSAAVTMRAGVVVAHVQQQHGDGHELCADLRRELRGTGDRCLMVVHGQAEAGEGGTAVVMVRAVSAADLVLAQELDPRHLLRAIGRRIRGLDVGADTDEVEYSSASRVQPGRRGRRLRAPSRAEVQAFFRRMDDHLRWPVVKEALLKPRTPLVDSLPSPDEISWREAMLARASVRNLRIVLSKPVTPLVRSLPEHRPPTLHEVLRSEVNLRNLRIVLGLEVPLPAFAMALSR